jgi:hypothetical protein
MEDKNSQEENPQPEKPVFEGFRKIDKESKHFYKLPNEWTDIMAEIDNLAELKVVEYIMRHTWGFGEHDRYKHITVDEFMHGRLKADGTRMDKGTGLKSDRSVKDGLKAAIEHGYILCEIDGRDKARIKKSYKLKMREVVSTPQNDQDGNEENRQVDTTPQDTNSYPSGTQNLPPGSPNATPRTKKETKGRKRKKDRLKESDSINHSLILSSTCLEKVAEFASMYGDDDPAISQELARRFYQKYDISEDDFYSYLYHAQAASSKTRQMTDFFTKLQKMLDDKFSKR